MLSTCTTLVEFEAVFAASGTVLDGVHPSMVTHGILQDAGVRRCTDRKAILRRCEAKHTSLNPVLLPPT